MLRTTKARAAGALSISAARAERPKRISTRSKSNVDKFLNAGSTDPTDKLLLEAAALWESHWLAISRDEGPQAITYSERVNKSLTHLGIQQRMAKTSDDLRKARLFRGATSALGRQLLDGLIIQDRTIEECARIRFELPATERPGKLHLERVRVEIRAFLMAFAGLTGLPGAR